MKTKRALGTLLTFFGIFGLIYATMLFLNHTGDSEFFKMFTIYGLLGVVFFSIGIGIMRTIADKT